MSHRFQLKHMRDHRRFVKSLTCHGCAWNPMGPRFSSRHRGENMDNLPNLWLVMNGCMKAHESSFSIKAHA